MCYEAVSTLANELKTKLHAIEKELKVHNSVHFSA